MTCNHCGKCCTNPIIALHNIPFDKDVNELGKWLSNHGCESLKLHNGKEDVLGIRLKSTCKHLIKSNDLYSCKIYDMRPQICRDYWCKDLIDKEVVKLAKEDVCSTLSAKE